MYWLDHKISKKLDKVASIYYDEFIQYMTKFTGHTMTKNKTEKLIQVVRCFFYNLQYELEDNTLVVTRDKNDYSRKLIYNGREVKRKVSYEYTLAFFSWLHQRGYAVSEIGFVGDWVKEADGSYTPKTIKQSKIILSDKMLSDFRSVILNKQDKCPINNVIRIRDESKNYVTKRLGHEQQHLCKLLQEFNYNAKNCIIAAGEKEFDVQVAKVYSRSSFEKGGRTYVVGTAIDVLKKENRTMLTIDGEKTVECDFKALHPRLIATMVGTHIPLEHDPYSIDVNGYDQKALRTICKLLVLCIVNANDFTKAMQAVHYALNKDTVVDENGNDVPLLQYWKDNKLVPEFLELRYLCKKLLSHNPYLNEYAFSDVGLDLQNLDSRIMDIVIEHFTVKKEFVLPVHDSIVVRESLKDEAVDVMTKAFAQVMGSSDNCIVEVK